jgi:uncharacterized protein (DUF1800 family)
MLLLAPLLFSAVAFGGADTPKTPAPPAKPQIPTKTQSAPTAAKNLGFTWDARAAEHLLNRAAFGARPGEIEAAVAAGPEAVVDRLLTQRADTEAPFFEPIEEPLPRELKELSPDDQKKAKREVAEKDRRQLLEYMGWWIDSMTRGDDPLLDRMTLFWHGLLTSSIDQVKRSYPMLQQNQLLRTNALGSYSDLLYGVAKDPAMLIFLNNNSNRKGNPNENLARELMELFSLGVGNYTEADIKEAARALTGRSTTREGKYVYRPGLHDDGEKTVLGVKGKLDGDGLVKVILQQDACPRYVARKIITYFEGVEPEKARLEQYATFLRKNEFKIQPFLRKLFLDPAFYRDEIVGARIQSPVEFMVSTSRRLGTQVPAIILGSGAALLGQRLFAPPSVKGWDEGISWITTSSLMQRGNLVGMMLGIVTMDDVLDQADMLASATDANTPATGDGEMKPADGGGMKPGDGAGKPDDGAKKPESGQPMSREKREEYAKRLKSGKKGGFAYEALRRAEQSGWVPAINFTARMKKLGLKTDAEITDHMLDDLLAIQPPPETRKKLLEFITTERVQMSVADGHLLDSAPDSEKILRRAAHLILSLPEGQLM